MKPFRFVPTPDGGSQFVELEIPIDNAATDAFGHIVRRSGIFPAMSTMLGEMPEGLNQDWHPTSRRQLVIVLSGTVESRLAMARSINGAMARCSSPTMSEAGGIAPARLAGRLGCCLFICRPN
jgi:hypothetical protein